MQSPRSLPARTLFEKNRLGRYCLSLGVTGLALYIWWLWPVMHQDPFAIFIAAVIVCARFLGFGPSVLCTATSALALDYFIFHPRHLSLHLSANDSERLFIFVLVALLTAGLARQRSRAELRASHANQRMAAIVESSDDAILSITEDGTIESWNRGAQKLYGYPPDEAIGRNIRLIVGDESVPPSSDRPTAYRAEHLRKDGSRLSVSLSTSPLRDPRGHRVGSSMIVRDITTQLKAEAALRRNERLATAGRMAATLAHEINNPLEAITNLIYLARHEPARSDNYLEIADQEVQHIAAISRQTLGSVRDAGSPSRVNVSTMLEQILRVSSRKLADRKIEIKTQFEAEAEVDGFEGELRQLFSNLIGNSMDALATGGRLTVRVKRSRGWNPLQPFQPGVRVLVADNGAGIARSDVPHIFEAFYTTKVDVGTGLGLWVSQGVVQKHGGTIKVRSRTGVGRSGSVFSVFLPSRR